MAKDYSHAAGVNARNSSPAVAVASSFIDCLGSRTQTFIKACPLRGNNAEVLADKIDPSGSDP